MEPITSFGYWVRRRRKALDLTQVALARRIHCSTIMIKKIEADERRPSAQIAGLLADCLDIPAQARAAFLNAASGEYPVNRLPAPQAALASELAPKSMSSHLLRPLAPMIGRDKERIVLTARLLRADVQILTLTGPGGVGKTRLALALVERLQKDFSGGIAVVSLAAIRNPELVAGAIAQAAGTPTQPGPGTLLDKVVHHLRGQQWFLLLDNFEHVMAAAPVVATLVAACPRLKILITSRERLRIQGEHEYPLLSLAVPSNRRSASNHDLAQVPAVEMFVRCVRTVMPDFVLTNENAQAVAEICRHLDGLPLALELAAARIKILPPQALLQRLDQSLDWLSGGRRDAPARHQTLRDALAWSYDLLTADEQALFRRLAVFVGGCTLEAVEAVCDADMAREGLASLVDKSLLQQIALATAPRFLQLETCRAYGWEQLQATGEDTITQRRHALHYLELAEQSAPMLSGADQATWLDQLEAEHNNLRAALQWSLDNQEPDIAPRLGTALWEFWYIRGYHDEGWNWLVRLAALPVQPAYQAQLLLGMGMLARRRGDYDAALARFDASLALFRQVGDRRGIASALRGLGFIHYVRGDYGAAVPLLEEGLGLFREVDDTEGVAVTLGNLGYIAQAQRQWEAARAWQTECLALRRRSGNQHGMASTLGSLTYIAIGQNDMAAAQAYAEESLSVSRAVGNQNGVGVALQLLGLLAFGRGDYDAAHGFFQQSLAIAQEIGDRPLLASTLMRVATTTLKRGDVATAALLLSQALDLRQQQGLKLETLNVLDHMANTALAQGQPEHALTLAGAMAALRKSSWDPGNRIDQLECARVIAQARAELSAEAANTAWTTGQAMTFEEVMAWVQNEVNEKMVR